MALTATTLFGVVVLLCVLAPWLPLPDPNHKNLSESLRPPFWLPGADISHPLGTDHLGRDMMSRLLFGGRLTLAIVFAAVVLAAAIGLLVGIVAGYRGGWIDTLLSRLVDTQLALPFILLALTFVIAAGSSVPILIVVLALGSWASFARVVRGEAIGLRGRTFVVALESAHIGSFGIIFRHILPNLTPVLLVVGVVQIGVMILAEAGLSFLGMGVSPPQVTWGTMLTGGKDYLSLAWWVIILPGLCIVLTTLSLNMLADVARDKFDPTVTRGGDK
ncbi:hypothetical protein CC117_32685 [Parafrankia colletiae]|uniref:ABC transmembrane type-1 domain-containing protein n=1 Tax=Parafrankia colletiae TaxID=573497 RepID=A0A1S1R964_9ACTN|nr:ABC transporter permease [Frankia sp. Cpl3]OHV43428.1 hypothetical protein CC117_32685 [Parafrankia colletiae]